MNGEANHWLADLPLTLTKIYEGSYELLQINREVVRAFSKGGINPAPTNDVPL
jgi:hypothetical protein